MTVLADMAVPVEEFDRALLAGVIKDTEEDVADAKDDWKRDKLAQKLDQLKALQAALGVATTPSRTSRIPSPPARRPVA